MMANDQIQDERNQSSSDSYDPKKHLSNPQEESFDEESSQGQQRQAKPLSEKPNASDNQEDDEDLLEQSFSNSNLVQISQNQKLRKSTSRSNYRKTRKESTNSNCYGDGKKNGRWSMMEHVRFLEALKNFGKNWKKVEEYVATRTSTQARSHAQKFFANIIKHNMTMENFLENISHDTLNQLRKIAQKNSDKNGGNEDGDQEMSEPEILKLLMMHMSKNHHEDELQTFGDSQQPGDSEIFTQDQTIKQPSSKQGSNNSNVSKRKRSAKVKIATLEQEVIAETGDSKISIQSNATFIQVGQDLNIQTHSIQEINHNSDINFQSSSNQASIEMIQASKNIFDTAGNDSALTPLRNTRGFQSKQSSQFISYSHQEFEGGLDMQQNTFNFNSTFLDITQVNNAHQDEDHIHLNNGRPSLISSSIHQGNLDMTITPSGLTPHLPFQHLAGNGSSSAIKNLLGDSFSHRHSRVSQDLLAAGGSLMNLGMTCNGIIGRSRGNSSFDYNDCFSKENHIEDIMGGGPINGKVPYSQSLFKKTFHS